MNLYKIADEYKKVFDDLNSIDGLDQEAFNDTLAVFKDDLELKAINVIKYQKSIQGDIQTIDDEIKQLSDRKKVMQNSVNRFTEYVRNNMINCGIDKIESPLFTLTLRKPVKSVSITVDTSELPKEFIVTKPATYAPDKKLIAKELKSGGGVFGCELVDGKRSLIIK